jgi:hypothetical protein
MEIREGDARWARVGASSCEGWRRQADGMGIAEVRSIASARSKQVA